MIENASVEVIRSWPADSSGWHVGPTGDDVKLGNYVTLGDRVTLGDGVKLGTYVTLGARVTLGDDVKLGNYVTLGDDVTLGDRVTLGDDVKLGNYVTLGDDVKLGDGVTSLELSEYFRSVLPPCFTATKWVTPDRKSPNFDGGTTIDYPAGAIICATGTADDQQCAPGLHVLRLGYRPEWCGLCDVNHNLIPLTVKIMREDVLFAGLPGNDIKLRVRRLEVID